jgi:hypothetical protein
MPLNLPLSSFIPASDVDIHIELSGRGLFIKNYDGSFSKVHHSGVLDGFYVLTWEDERGHLLY